MNEAELVVFVAIAIRSSGTIVALTGLDNDIEGKPDGGARELSLID